MTTPICDFVRRYAARDVLRLHMPGHKGRGPLGAEALDITEIPGADSLYEAAGVIRESEANAGALFGAHTFYSTEGSSLCIRAMLYLALLRARETGRPAEILAGRNAHKAFLSAAALLDLSVRWLLPAGGSHLSCPVTAADLAAEFSRGLPAAVYLTSPDYLGNTVDVAALSAVCRRHGVPLLIDNAHGAYLRFLSPSRHPMDLGADACCDSAHKTLPVLTGGAYLHVSAHAPAVFSARAREALALFGSTSPSYLILQSLDAANASLAADYRGRLAAFLAAVADCRARLTALGYTLVGDEPLKLTLAAKPYGCTGTELAQALRSQGIEPEFADPDFLVLMVTPETGETGLARLADALAAVPRRPARTDGPPALARPEPVLSVRQAAFSPAEEIPAAQSAGRVLAAATVGCPPAVPIVVCGERIDPAAVRCFAYYGVERCRVVAEPATQTANPKTC